MPSKRKTKVRRPGSVSALKAEHKKRLAAKRGEKRSFGTDGVHTSEGIKVRFGYRDGRGVFHQMTVTEYVKEFKKVAGHPPVHELLLQAKGVSDKDKDYIQAELAKQRMQVKKAAQLIHQEEDVAVDGIPVKSEVKKEPTTKKGEKKG